MNAGDWIAAAAVVLALSLAVRDMLIRTQDHRLKRLVVQRRFYSLLMSLVRHDDLLRKGKLTTSFGVGGTGQTGLYFDQHETPDHMFGLAYTQLQALFPDSGVLPESQQDDLFRIINLLAEFPVVQDHRKLSIERGIGQLAKVIKRQLGKAIRKEPADPGLLRSEN